MVWRSGTKIVAAAALAAGCATADPDLAAARDSWQGARYDDVVRAWGAPARSSRLADGRESHTWMSEDVGVIRGSGGAGGVGGILFGEAGDPARCDRTLVFSAGQVVEQKWLGPAAYCNRFKASRP